MKKIIYDFSDNEFHPFQEFWKEKLPQEFAKMEIIKQSLPAEQIKKSWKTLLQKPDASLMSSAQSAEFFKALPKLPQRILECHMIDSVFKDSRGNWWPNCLFRTSLHELIVRRVPNLDTHEIAYIVGADHMMRMAVSVVIQLGFEGVNIVIDDMKAREGVLEDLKRTYFDTEIRLIRNSELTLQKNNGTVLINTVPLENRDELSEDLSYLNFILSDGVVIDSTLIPLKNHLLSEAEHVGLTVISGAELLAQRDWNFLKNVFGKVSLNPIQYAEQWLEFLQRTQNQANPAEGPVTK